MRRYINSRFTYFFYLQHNAMLCLSILDLLDESNSKFSLMDLITVGLLVFANRQRNDGYLLTRISCMQCVNEIKALR